MWGSKVLLGAGWIGGPFLALRPPPVPPPSHQNVVHQELGTSHLGKDMRAFVTEEQK